MFQLTCIYDSVFQGRKKGTLLCTHVFIKCKWQGMHSKNNWTLPQLLCQTSRMWRGCKTINIRLMWKDSTTSDCLPKILIFGTLRKVSIPWRLFIQLWDKRNHSGGMRKSKDDKKRKEKWIFKLNYKMFMKLILIRFKLKIHILSRVFVDSIYFNLMLFFSWYPKDLGCKFSAD